MKTMILLAFGLLSGCVTVDVHRPDGSRVVVRATGNANVTVAGDKITAMAMGTEETYKAFGAAAGKLIGVAAHSAVTGQ